MALDTNRGKNNQILFATNIAATQVTVGDVTAGQVEQHAVGTIKSTDESANLPTANYTRTNFYIRQTCQYIPSRQLHVFINFRWFRIIMPTVLFTQLTTLFVVSILDLQY